MSTMILRELKEVFNNDDFIKCNIKQEESLSSHTTMNVGGKAELFFEPETVEILVNLVKFLQEKKVQFYVLGGGSNLIINDSGIKVMISTRKLRIKEPIYEESELSEDSVSLNISSGISWGHVISFCKKNNYSNFEAFTGLSGTVGGAIYMNATCFGLSTCDNLISVKYLDVDELKICEYMVEHSDWGYKKSPFKDGVAGKKIIIAGTFKVKKGHFDSDFSDRVLTERKAKGHFRYPSAGSVFKNDIEKEIIAGKIIEECGLKGFKIGGAEVASFHGNFIINPERKASAKDIKSLVDYIKDVVKKKKNIILENEIIFI